MNTNKPAGKSKYNMWQNTGFMLRTAWNSCKSVIFLCIALGAATAGVTITELLIAPMILSKVETTAPRVGLPPPRGGSRLPKKDGLHPHDEYFQKLCKGYPYFRSA